MMDDAVSSKLRGAATIAAPIAFRKVQNRRPMHPLTGYEFPLQLFRHCLIPVFYRRFLWLIYDAI